MVRQPKNIQWWWSPQKPLEICNGLFKTIEIYNYCKNKCWETFSLLYCVIFTLWNDVRSQYIWSISNGFYGFWLMRSAQNLCFVVNRFYALFRLNGSSKPSLTSKPLLTIALKILKTIEKPLVPMVGPPKKHSMVMVQLCQNHWKTIDGDGGLKKTLTIPSPWKIDHRCGLVPDHSNGQLKHKLSKFAWHAIGECRPFCWDRLCPKNLKRPFWGDKIGIFSFFGWGVNPPNPPGSTRYFRPWFSCLKSGVASKIKAV